MGDGERVRAVFFKLPFQNENLITDDKAMREAWEAHEWSSFACQVREWLNVQYDGAEKQLWDCWVSFQMLFILANCVRGNW